MVSFRHSTALSAPRRNARIRAAAKAIWEGSGRAAQEEYERIRLPDDPAMFDEYVARLDPVIDPKTRLNLIVRAFDNEAVGQHINNMNWGVVDVVASPHQPLTSDRPVGLFNIKDPRGMITLPISPTKLFVAVNDLRIFGHLKKPKEIVRQNNTLVVSRARRFVWAADPSQTSFIEKHMSKALEPTPFSQVWAITRSLRSGFCLREANRARERALFAERLFPLPSCRL